MKDKNLLKSVLIIDSDTEFAVPLTLWPQTYELTVESELIKIPHIVKAQTVDLIAVSCGTTKEYMIDLITDINFSLGKQVLPLLLFCNLNQRISVIPGTGLWPGEIGIAHTLTNKETFEAILDRIV